MFLRLILFHVCFACCARAGKLAPHSGATVLTPRQSLDVEVIREVQNPDGSVPLFAYEEDSLTPTTLRKLTKSALFDFAADVTSGCNTTTPNYTLPGPGNCKYFPGDAGWPSLTTWSALNHVTGGALLHPKPAAAPCYDENAGGANGTECQALTANWTSPYFLMAKPLEMMFPLYEGMTCQPPAIFDSGNCTQGGYSVYVVNATSVSQIQLAVNFARNTGVRLVVKNTGHDFSGKSYGAGSLSIWTHYLKEMAYLPNYTDSSYSGPAMKAGAGIQGFELYAAANSLGLLLLGGECPTVGAMGGWIQGGGHSPVTPMYGLGADQALGFELVTADGRFVTANKDINPDLFWALRGGGGSTYGVVTSVIVRAHQDIPIATATFSFATGPNVSTDAFNAGLRSYVKTFPQGAEAQIQAYFSVFNFGGDMSFTMEPYWASNKTIAETQALLQPWLSEMDKLGIPITPNYTLFSGYYEAHMTSFPVTPVINLGVDTASRMFPSQNWANETIFNETYAVLWENVVNGLALIVYNMKPNWGPNGVQNDSVNPAWRDNIGYIITGIQQNLSLPHPELAAQRENFTYGAMQRWRDVTPGSGSYLNEADLLEPNFQWSFWGSFYPKLLELKQRYDPWNLFYAPTAVGSEFFEIRTFDGLTDEDGKLCVNPSPKLYYAEGPDYVLP